MLCFFKLPHSFDVSHISLLLLFGIKVGLQMSPEAQFSYQKGREAWCVSTVHSSLALCCPLCTLKRLLFQSSVCCGSSVLKALPTCLYAGRSRRLGSPWSCAVNCCHGSFYVVLWDLTLSPHRSGVPRTQGADPHPSLKPHMAPGQSVNHLQTDELSFIWGVRSNVCVVSKNQHLVSDVCTAEPRVHFPTAECVCCSFLLFFIRCPGSFTNLIRCKDVGLLNGTPRFFFTW